MLQYSDLYADLSLPEPCERAEAKGAMIDLRSDIAPASPGERPDCDEALLRGIGRMVFAWGRLESELERKIADLRRATGDGRTVTARTRPTMGKMLAELRAIISMRNRRDNAALAEISRIERTIQTIGRFRALILEGLQSPVGAMGAVGPALLCRDTKNNGVSITLDDLGAEIDRLDDCRQRLLSL